MNFWGMALCALREKLKRRRPPKDVPEPPVRISFNPDTTIAGVN